MYNNDIRFRIVCGVVDKPEGKRHHEMSGTDGKIIWRSIWEKGFVRVCGLDHNRIVSFGRQFLTCSMTSVANNFTALKSFRNLTSSLRIYKHHTTNFHYFCFAVIICKPQFLLVLESL